jgi:Glycolipid 2-alpha-mannosyltransferase
MLMVVPLRPDVTFYCDLDFDPFLFMQDNDKVYGAHKNKYLFSQL